MKNKEIFSSFKNQVGESIGQIDIFGPIGRGSMFSDEYSAKDFISDFKELEETCSKIIINIFSEGGSVFEGNQIATVIKGSNVFTHAKLGALCGSIATVISSACKKVTMPNNSLFFVHAPLTGLQGNAHDLRETAKLLDKIEETILNIYEDKCGGKKTRAEIKQLVAGENNDGQGTWMTAQEAFEAGFVDEIGHELKMVAQYDGPSNIVINGIKMDLSGFKNTSKIKELIENKSNNKLEETNMSEISKSGILSAIDSMANYAKSLFGINAEVEPETQVEQVEAQETNLEVQNEQTQEVPEVVETVAEDTEAQEEIAEPSVEVTEEIEPSTETEPVAIVEPEAEIIAEVEQPEVQEEPEVAQDEPEITEEPEQVEEEIEPSPEATVSVPEVSASIDLAKEVANLKAQILERDTKLAKAELAKEIGNKFRGVPGKLEDKVELVYELKNSALSESSKEMILKSLENLSAQNLESTKELGHSEEVIVDELTEMEQAKAMSQKEGISEGQALLVMSGKRTLEQAKSVKRK